MKTRAHLHFFMQNQNNISEKFQVVSVQINPQVFDSYYNGCCNATFWPLFHSMPDRATFKGQHWNSYTIANKEFADCTIRALRELVDSGDNIGTEPPLIWIHDYHLMLAANWIRQVLDCDWNRRGYCSVGDSRFDNAQSTRG